MGLERDNTEQDQDNWSYNNNNLVVPYKRVCQQSQLNLLYMFYA